MPRRLPLDPAIVHPAVAAQAGGADLAAAELGPAERGYADTLLALVDSRRTPEELAEAAGVLNPLLDLRARAGDPAPVDAVADRILGAARAARDAGSGMGCDLALDHLRLGLDDARRLLARP